MPFDRPGEFEQPWCCTKLEQTIEAEAVGVITCKAGFVCRNEEGRPLTKACGLDFNESLATIGFE